ATRPPLRSGDAASAARRALRRVETRGRSGESLYSELIDDVRGEGERRRQARRFDAVKIDEAGHAMLARGLHHEVAVVRTGMRELGPHPGIIGLERAIGQCRPIAADRLGEKRLARRIDAVVDMVDPFDIGAETRASAKIESGMKPR